MTDAKIRLFPDAVLRKSALIVRHFDEELQKTAELLIKTMRHQPSGIGIAAPQISISKRIAVVDVSARIKTGQLRVLINPEILELREGILSREGCMSLPDYTADVKRFNRILVQWQDLNGENHSQWFEGIEARCIQHEVDHLNGLLFLDRVASLKTDMIPRKK